MKKLFIVNSDYHETRIDRWLKNNFSTLNQSFIEKNLRKGNIKVNDSKVLARYKLLHKDKIIIFNYSEEIYSHVAKLSNKTIIPKKYLELFNSSIIFENKDFYKKKVDEGLTRAKLFDYEKMHQKIINLYEEEHSKKT